MPYVRACNGPSELLGAQATELHKAYKEKLMYDAYEVPSLRFCVSSLPLTLPPLRGT